MEKKICSKCQETKPISDFGLNRLSKNGYQSWCKQCDAAHKREVRFNRPAHSKYLYDKQLKRNKRARVHAEKRSLTKECRACNETFPATTDHFYRANGKLGLATNCKACDNKKRQERRNKRKAPTDPAKDWEIRQERRKKEASQ